MNDLIKPVGQWIASNIPLSVGIGLFLFCLFFEISKIKVYPLKWLWKAISWPFRKIDEQRTQSFKNIVASMKTDLDAKLEEMQAAANSNCDSVKACLTSLESKFSDLEGRFDALDAAQSQTDERLDKLAAARIKNHVLNFARQCRKGEEHSREDYRNLFEEVKIYDALVLKYQSMDEAHFKAWENNVFKHDFAYIEQTFDECNKTNSFLDK